MDTFHFQPGTLVIGATAMLSATDFSFVVNYPLPGNPGAQWEGGHGVAHLPGAAIPDQFGYATVGTNAAARNRAHLGIDARVQGINW